MSTQSKRPTLTLEQQNNFVAIPWLNKLNVGDLVDILHPDGIYFVLYIIQCSIKI